MKSILTICFSLLFLPFYSYASTQNLSYNFTNSWVGYICVGIFVIAYIFVMFEEKLQLKKSKPVLLAAGLIWLIIGFYFSSKGLSEVARDVLKHNLEEYAELLLFLLVAMTYISAMEERRVFDKLKAWLIEKEFSYTKLFWITGILSFCISPIADNLTTALLMCAVVLKVGKGNLKFINLACINIVLAANAGGAFSPFGDITTLMVWQDRHATFFQFFYLFIPAVVNYMIPALIMSFFISKETPLKTIENVELKRGAKRIIALFLVTVCTSVFFHAALDLPPAIGMMMGLAYLQLFGFFLQKTLPKSLEKKKNLARLNNDMDKLERLGSVVPFDVFKRISLAEWDTLLFFYGVVLSVGGLSLLGYLSVLSNVMYTHWNPIYANSLVGIISAIIDNIPVMFAVLSMEPHMSLGNWLLITLTAGVGGSLLSIGSAAGVALMGAAHGKYTFMGHLKWTPVIFLGYVASIITHLFINANLF
ncbi:sodium:proton antiporter [Paraphotobacterium marinum]|uniref:Sodium:proton antiporter n=1 Tax=Paraphotobacterium marinum TaxID=1755811 RepID=A0A220VHT8_9GAMM|nr:sodium:proton antiporter NhaD [Paraphotobacterium marinum]ASK79820.1 sodium:proton antiporter [Paraphotobacterium marinum]